MKHYTWDMQGAEDRRKRHVRWRRTVTSVMGIAVVVGSLTMLGCGGDDGELQPATPAQLENRTFAFANGAVFHDGLARTPVTLLFGDFNGTTTGPYRLRSTNGSTAIGRATIASCDLVTTSSTFAPSEGPQVGDRFSADCTTDSLGMELQVEANGTRATSTSAADVQPTLTGVVYVESNKFGENANSILAFRRDAAGTLTALPGSPFLTGGSGVAVQEVPIVGPFDSDQELIVNAERTRLFAVNSGSDTIAVFDILPDGGLVPAPASPFDSGGINPVSVGLAGNRLYVANKNDDPMRPQVTADNFPNYVGFTVEADGSLTQIPDSEAGVGNVTLTSRTHPPSQALVSPDHRFLFDANFFSSANVDDQPGLLQSFRINADGTLVQNTPVAPPSFGRGGNLVSVAGSPFASGGFTPVSLGLADNRLYVANNNANPMLPDRLNNFPNYTGFDVAANGALTSIPGSTVTLELPTQNPTQALISPNHNFLFGTDLFGNQTDFGPSALQSFQIQADGTLVSAPNSPLLPPVDDFAGGLDLNSDGTPERWILGLQVHPTQPILYAGFVTASRLGVYTYDEMTGELTFVRSVPNNGRGICWVLVNQAGTRLYTTNTQDDTVSVYDLADPLTPVEIQTVPLNGNGKALQLALDDNEQFMYVISHRVFPDDPADGTSNKLSVLQVNADGTLTEVASSPTILDVPLDPFTRPQGVAVIDDVVYVESNIPTGNSIIAYRRDELGNLTQLPNSPFATGGNGIGSDPNSLPLIGPFDTDQNIITNPEQTRVFAVNGGSDQISVFDVVPLGTDLNGDGQPDALPLGLQVHPTEPLLYVGLVTGAKLGVYEYDQTTGALTLVQAVPNSGLFICWIVVNQDGTRLYTTNSGNDTVSVYNIENPRTPVEIQTVELKGNGSPLQLALDRNEEFLYTVKQRAFPVDPVGEETPPGEGNFLSVLRVNADGTLTEVDSSPLPLGVDDVAPPVIRPQGVAAL
jgi:6-phosphogluconolactonase (cycloisomerase 2 family)